MSESSGLHISLGPTRRQAGLRFEGGARFPSEDAVSVEWPLHILLNGAPFAVTMRTPGADLDLVRGLFCSEGIATAVEPRQSAAHEVAVEIPEPYAGAATLPHQQLAATSSCGLCGNQQLVLPGADSIRPLPTSDFDPETLPDLFALLRAGQQDFATSGGCHGVALFAGTQCLALAEDIGRHNAVDKVIGRLLAEQRLADADCLLVSGRVSYEIVAKAWRAGVPVVASVSAPSSLAIEMATRFGMHLYAFCREGRATAYAGPALHLHCAESV